MENVKFVFFMILSIVILLLVACQTKLPDDSLKELVSPSESASGNTQKNEKVTPNYNMFNSPESPNTVPEKAFVSVEYMTDEILVNYDSVHEFVDYENEYAQKIIFTTNTAVKGFRYIEIGHKENDTGLVYFENTVLYLLDELLPEKPFVVTWMEAGDVVAYRGIAFTDENNTTRYFYITISGKDDSLLLIEFQPA